MSVSCLPSMHNTAVGKNRTTRRAFGHNPCCDNQSSVVLRGEIYLRNFNFTILNTVSVFCNKLNR